LAGDHTTVLNKLHKRGVPTRHSHGRSRLEAGGLDNQLYGQIAQFVRFGWFVTAEQINLYRTVPFRGRAAHTSC
jgi:hypothetical protein